MGGLTCFPLVLIYLNLPISPYVFHISYPIMPFSDLFFFFNYHQVGRRSLDPVLDI